MGIFKKGVPSEPSNYRPISLLQNCYKLYARVLAARLSRGLEPFLRDNQYGLIGRAAVQAMLFHCLKAAGFGRCSQNQVLYLVFLDWSKAFDTINPSALHLALERLQVSPQMRAALGNLTAPPFQVVTADDMSSMRIQASGMKPG